MKGKATSVINLSLQSRNICINAEYSVFTDFSEELKTIITMQFDCKGELEGEQPQRLAVHLCHHQQCRDRRHHGAHHVSDASTAGMSKLTKL